MKLIAITNNPDRAAVYQDAGVDRIMVDLEINGKEERQGHLNTLISRHKPEDVSKLRSVLSTGELMVRTNPIFDDSPAEIDDILARGADRLMLPMFRHPDEVRQLIDIVDGRAELTLLVETAAAFARLPQILSIDADFDLHIGLNDLHLEYKLDFMFEIFTSGLLDHVARLCAQSSVAFGIGGIARVGKGLVPGELVIAEHVRLGSSRVILSRDFSELAVEDHNDLEREISKIRDAITSADGCQGGTQPEQLFSTISNIANQRRRDFSG